jgi:hypothetical protein
MSGLYCVVVALTVCETRYLLTAKPNILAYNQGKDEGYAMTLEMIIEEIRTLPVRERKRLIGMIVDTLPEETSAPAPRKHNILEFEGVGADMWRGVDVQAYLDEMRNEWDNPRED